MAAPKKAKRPKPGAPPKWNVEQYANAKARGLTQAEAVEVAGRPPEGTTEIAAKKAGRRMESHPEVQLAIQRATRDLIRDMAKKRVEDLWPDMMFLIENMGQDKTMSDGNKIKLVELVAKLCGRLNNDAGVAVQVVQVGQQAREEIRLLQRDGAAQQVVLDELERRTTNGFGGSSGPVDAETFNTDDPERADLTRPGVTLENEDEG